MNRREMLEESCAAEGGLAFFEGLDDAIIGVRYAFGEEQAVAYDYAKSIKLLEAHGMTEEEAVEYFHFNILGAHIGEHTPVFIETYD